jgi:restriction system protein
MAEVTRERTGQIVRTVFEILEEHPEGVQARDVIEETKRRLPPTDFEKSLYPTTSAPRFDKILRFSTIGPVKAGWMTKSKGNWIVTDAGRMAYKDFKDPADFMREASKLYNAWRKAQIDTSDETTESVEAVTSGATLEEAEESAWSEISTYLRAMPPYDFQDLIAALLRGMGYHVAWVAPPGKDDGLDIVSYTDPLGAEGPRIKTQVRRRNESKTTLDDLRSFLSTLSNQDVGIFVSTSGFTVDATREARRQETRRITLIDLETFFDLWVENYENLNEQDRQRLPLKPVYFLSID